MEKRQIILLLLLSVFPETFSHPVHVSVVNLTLNEKTLKLSLNTFVDDWETAYFHYYGKKISLKEPAHLQGDWFRDYLEASLKVSEGKKGDVIQFTIDTVYFDELSMHIELSSKLKQNPKTLYIYNAILTDIFADQTNLLIYSSGNREKGIKFDFHRKEEVLNLR